LPCLNLNMSRPGQSGRGGVVKIECVDEVVSRVVVGVQEMGIEVAQQVVSRIRGSGGNQEFFLLARKEKSVLKGIQAGES